MSSSICGKNFRFNLWRIRVEFEKIVCPVTYGHPCSYISTTGTCQLNRVVKKFSDFAISIQRNGIPSISLLHIFEVVILIFYGKFHPNKSLLRYPVEVNNRYWIDTLFIAGTKLLQLVIIYSTLNIFQQLIVWKASPS